MHALIIEDEVLLALQVEVLLRDHGFETFDLAATETEAVKAAQVRSPDLITSDVRLAKGCGISAVQSICSEQPIPVIFVTGSEEEVRERRPGALVLGKPVSPAAFANALRNIS